MSVRSRDQTAAASQRQFLCVDSLTLKALIRLPPGKAGGRNTEPEVTTAFRAYGIIFLSFYAAIDEYDNLSCNGVHLGLRLLDRAADHTHWYN